VGVLLLFIFALEGAYRLVRQERQASMMEREKLAAEIKRLQAEKSAPDLVGQILQTGAGHDPNSPGSTGAIINISIVNRGAPSIVDQFGVRVSVGGTPRRVSLLAATNAEMHMPDRTKVSFSAGDAIYEKGTQRVETGGQIRGWLFAQVDGTTSDEFFRVGTTVQISFQDFLGKTYVVTQTMKGANNPMLYFPGAAELGREPLLRHVFAGQ
jgi:hypothetical protein